MNRNNKANYRKGISAFNNGAEYAARTLVPYEGRACPTAFAEKASNPDNKKKDPRKGLGRK